ncbi:MAG: bile acid:sodium symporter [Planctomycetota bacterium]|nr:bile acid:sodium symporter [Planctomycetota bacterium]MDA1252622.1 bile acid:sodium symporter [Planctomycetota bacterium]
MIEYFIKRWFLISLLILIVSGITLGYVAEAEKIEAFRELVPARWVTAFVLLLMSFSLDSRQLKAAFKSPAPVMWACSTNYLLIPLLGWAAMSFQQTPDFTIGLMIACSTPCTLAACSVWTRKAGGNDAVSLLTTLTTNTSCFIIAPFWLTMAAGRSVELDVYDLAGKLVFVVLIPTLAGQFIRQPARCEEFARKNKTAIGVVAQSSILFLVFLSACAGGVKLQEQGGLSTQVLGIAVVWLSCVAIHLIALAAAWYGGGAFGFERKDRIGATFAGSQKTLPIGVYLATDPSTFGGAEAFLGQAVPFAVFPMLMFHASQLFLDTIVADKLKQPDPENESQATEPASTDVGSTTDNADSNSK